MSLITDIAKTRLQLLDGINANGGDINLRIFEDFYPDEAHFIFELLQNAEDAGATEISFELTAQGCSFEHNGTRPFNEQDIRGITGIFNSSKKNNSDKIGKFGVGFKSVFVYTATPYVYSKNYSFKIEQLILPIEVPPFNGLGACTRFEFPFNEPKMKASKAYDEVKTALERLTRSTLLFLKNIAYIKWQIPGNEGSLHRIEHTKNHVEIVRQVGAKHVRSAHWLHFSAPVIDLEQQVVSIAFELALTGDNKLFDKSKAIKEQLKIVPADPGKVSVFFPAEKETSGLRFHLHGPFIPELSRASIKSSTENLTLFDQIAKLTAKSLHLIKDLGLLNAEFLAVLPNNDDSLGERYEVIRTATLDEMRVSPLVPTSHGDHASATRLLQSRADLKRLLTSDDLAFITEREDAPDWAVGVSQKNSPQDKFLRDLGIEDWDAGNLQDFFENRAREGSKYHYWDKAKVDPLVLDWLENKSYEWLQSLYALLFRHCEEEGFGHLSDVYFVKTSSGSWHFGADSFFPNENPAHSEYTIDEKLLTSGTNQKQKENARKFLEELGVHIPSETDDIQLLINRYSDKETRPSHTEYCEHLARMITYLEKNPAQKEIFGNARLFKVQISVRVAAWVTAQSVYLDEPYGNSNLSLLYSMMSESEQEQKRYPLNTWYLDCGIAVERVIKFAEALGCQKEFDRIYRQARCEDNPNWTSLNSKAWGLSQRSGNVIDRDFALAPVAIELLASRKIPAIQLVWNGLCRANTSYTNILQAVYQITDKVGAQKELSQLVCTLRDMDWVPQTNSTFVKPKDAISTLLPKGFTYDSGYKWLQAIDFGVEEHKKIADATGRTEELKKLGFESEEEWEQGRKFNELFSPEERKELLATKQRQSQPVELPERAVKSSDLRSQRVSEVARNTPEKKTELRERSVTLGAEAVKAEAQVYLQDQYTNANGQMICQVCKYELPFKRLNGGYFFEKVELIDGSEKRHRETYLALCPNHAAMYKYANKQLKSMAELLLNAATVEIELELGGRKTTIYFTETHLADVRACLEADDGFSK